jgi:S-adenosyl methyltransferase
MVLAHGTALLGESGNTNIHFRSKAEVERFFEGLELVEPYEGAGPVVTHVGLWGPRIRRRPTPTTRGGCTAVWRGAPDLRRARRGPPGWQIP